MQNMKDLRRVLRWTRCTENFHYVGPDAEPDVEIFQYFGSDAEPDVEINSLSNTANSDNTKYSVINFIL